MPLRNPKVVDPNIVQSVSAIRTVDITMASTTYATLQSLSITTTGSTNILIWISYCLSFSTGVTNECRLRLQVDGTTILVSGEEEFTIAQSGAIVHRVAGATAAAHTITLQWRIGNTGEGTLRCRPATAPPEGVSIFAMEVSV